MISFNLFWGFDLCSWIGAVMMQKKKKKKKAYFVDDDGAPRMVEDRFLNVQPHFAASDYRKI
ncbi:hypothetical protein Hanom_Chr16g01430481 [Helianthus anomalus]